MSNLTELEQKMLLLQNRVDKLETKQESLERRQDETLNILKDFTSKFNWMVVGIKDDGSINNEALIPIIKRREAAEEERERISQVRLMWVKKIAGIFTILGVFLTIVKVLVVGF
jgi:hypothetical protein